MASKTFKIGEYCRGGIITAVATENKITIIGKEWDFSKGSMRGSDQSNAKEWTRLEVDPNVGDTYRKIYEFISDLATSYYASTILDWIESKTKITVKGNW